MFKKALLALVWALLVTGIASADYDDFVDNQGLPPREFTNRNQDAHFGDDVVIGGNLVVLGVVVTTLVDETP